MTHSPTSWWRLPWTHKPKSSTPNCVLFLAASRSFWKHAECQPSVIICWINGQMNNEYQLRPFHSSSHLIQASRSDLLASSFYRWANRVQGESLVGLVHGWAETETHACLALRPVHTLPLIALCHVDLLPSDAGDSRMSASNPNFSPNSLSHQRGDIKMQWEV